MEVGQILTLVLGGGATATIVAVFNGVRALREGSTKREKDTIGDLILRREEADADRKEAYVARDKFADERDWWRNWAGLLEYELRSNGHVLPVRPPMNVIPPPLPPEYSQSTSLPS